MVIPLVIKPHDPKRMAARSWSWDAAKPYATNPLGNAGGSQGVKSLPSFLKEGGTGVDAAKHLKDVQCCMMLYGGESHQFNTNVNV